MLEIRNLTKIYKAKGGVETRALDDVSISFGETGLVFLLGKSGSGKSTLLNLAGGLDEPTSGEVIVMGKSSKDFSSGDFDSYRNTFVGFVFQEYNVLNEFSVEDNIALALELQGKKKDQAKIQSLLAEVELEAYAKRKPNTLSGGQKQRIAIARALIKDPQIIMADEPTGALDSATGKQVFETLKELSKTRLVIVVSHDREFAEIYGDRIVELKDGKIISDVSKVTQQATTLSERVMRIDEDTISVRGGANDAATLAAIQSFLNESNGEFLISRSGRDIASFKRINHISDDGAREHFLDTDPEKTPPYAGEPAQFIRSKLPAGKAIKIGASGLRLKPFRLILTIFLSFIALVMFGLFTTMMFYNRESVLTKSFISSEYNYLALSKQYEYTQNFVYLVSGDEYSYSSSADAFFTPDEVSKLSQRYGDAVAGWEVNTNISNISTTDNNIYYKYHFNKAALVSQSSAMRSLLLEGSKYPTAANEICVSTYLLESIQNATYRVYDAETQKVGAEKNIRGANDLIGEYLVLNSIPFKVTGVFDSGAISPQYDKLKTSPGNYMDQMNYEAYLNDGLHTLMFVSDAFYDEYNRELISSYRYNPIQHFDWTYYNVQLLFDEMQNSYTYIYGVKVYDPTDPFQLKTKFLSGSPRALGENEIIIAMTEYNLGNLISWENPYDGEEWDSLRDENYAAWEKLYNGWYEQVERYSDSVRTYLYHTVSEQVTEEHEDGGSSTYYVDRPATDKEVEDAWKYITDYLSNPEKKTNLTIPVLVDGISKGNYNIVGFYIDYQNGNYNSDGLYCSETLYLAGGISHSTTTETKYVASEDEIFSFVFIPFEKTEKAFHELLSTLGAEHKNAENDVFYVLANSLYQNVMSVSETIDLLSKIFLWVGLGLAVFASLLLANFITMSISNKKKEIGILRAVGARGADVFKIFFAESGIIVGICTVLALIGSIVVSFVLNSVLKAGLGLNVALFVFGPLSVVVMIAVALVVALVATFLPVRAAAKKKPVESIRSL